MKRYIVLLALVSMQANIALPNMWESIKSKLRSSFTANMNSVFGLFKTKERTLTLHEPRSLAEYDIQNSYLDRDEKKRIIDQNFVKPFDDAFTKNDLDFKNRKNAAPLKHLSRDYLLQHLNTFPYPNKEAIENAIKEEGAFCVADFVGAQKKAEYKKQTDRNPLVRFLSEYQSQFNGYFFEDAPKYDKTIKEKIRQKAYLEAVSDFKQGNRASFAHLVNDGPIEKDLLKKTEKLSKMRTLCHALVRANNAYIQAFENSGNYDSRNWN